VVPVADFGRDALVEVGLDERVGAITHTRDLYVVDPNHRVPLGPDVLREQAAGAPDVQDT
jgi:hypothetical protein